MEYFWVTVREIREHLELVEAESYTEARAKAEEYYINDGIDMEHAEVVGTSYYVKMVE